MVATIWSRRAADVKRCLAMKDALALLDYGDASIADLRRLLLRAAFAPAFLRAADGRRFLAHLFTLDVRIRLYPAFSSPCDPAPLLLPNAANSHIAFWPPSNYERAL